jgi:hypothetical protein
LRTRTSERVAVRVLLKFVIKKEKRKQTCSDYLRIILEEEKTPLPGTDIQELV